MSTTSLLSEEASENNHNLNKPRGKYKKGGRLDVCINYKPGLTLANNPC